MATKIGFSIAKIAELDNSEKIVTSNVLNGIYTLTPTNSDGVISAAITGKAATYTPYYGGDQRTGTSGRGVGSLQNVLSVNDFAPEILNYLTGMVQDGKTGAWKAGSTTVPKAIAMELVTHDKKGLGIYYGLYHGILVPGDTTLNSNQDTEQRTTDSVTMQCQGRLSDGQYYTEGYASDTKFTLDAFETDVFPTAVSNS
ncbi:Hypothetical protein ADU71_1305 [Pediococcus damnosus]|uniref:phage tail protein n=1 Tax=Pediococcus damnosus TaxID=51663 RepID=UPI00078D299D|nr:phage tail protein [Pediococcus damnosus]AMV65201.1 Hypothetical protein ADU71_1305 [Pediococcus damnosus]